MSKTDQVKTNQNYEAVREITGGTISYSGNAFINCYSKYKMNLFVDDRHPTSAGSYLSACCLYSTIYKKSPQNVSYVAGLKSDLAHKLQGVAAETMEVESYESVSANREPRIKIIKNNKNYVSITVYDNAGIREDNLKLYMIKDNQKTEIKYTSKSVSKNRPESFDYTFKVSQKLFTTNTPIEFQLKATDGTKTCYINEYFTIRKLANKNSSGNYFTTNRAPRVTVKKSGDNLVLNVVDGNGIQKVIITTISDSNGNYTKLMNLKESDITNEFSSYFKSDILEEAKIGTNLYKFRVIASDSVGRKVSKTMIIRIK